MTTARPSGRRLPLPPGRAVAGLAVVAAVIVAAAIAVPRLGEETRPQRSPDVPRALAPSAPRQDGIWISPSEIRAVPTSGAAWDEIEEAANELSGRANLSDDGSDHDVETLAAALVYARTGDEQYRRSAADAVLGAIGTETGDTTLPVGRNLVSYVVAADLIDLGRYDSDGDERFRGWLRDVRHRELEGRTLVSTHEDRPNNWGTMAGASRAAIAVYLGDAGDLARTAGAFKGYLGDRRSYAGFTYGDDLSWQADRERPVGINPKETTINGHSVDGVLPDDQRRAGPFTWPPPYTNYAWEGLQGAIVQAEILDRAGYPAWDWEDRALLRAARWLYAQGFAPEGDDEWQPWLLNAAYGSDFPVTDDAGFGKNMGWTAWTHSRAALTGDQTARLSAGALSSASEDDDETKTVEMFCPECHEREFGPVEPS